MQHVSFPTEMPGLAAPGPAPEIGHAAELFAPLIGDWRMRSTRVAADGSRTEFAGFWSFRWGLGGMAVYDVIGFRDAEAADDVPYRPGITVRFYDLERATWRQAWIGPHRGVILEFAVRGDGSGGILIDGASNALERTRWQFVRIDAEHFDWEGRESKDGGATWRLTQTITGDRA